MSIFFILYVTNVAKAQELWNGASYGMSLEEVKAVFPDAVESSANEIQDSRLFDDSTALLKIKNFLLADRTFQVNFYFLKNKLERIHINLDGNDSFKSRLAMFNKLVPILKERFGKNGVSKKSPRSTGLVVDSRTVEWISGKTQIELYFIGIKDSDHIPVVQISYAKKTEPINVAKEAKKL